MNIEKGTFALSFHYVVQEGQLPSRQYDGHTFCKYYRHNTLNSFPFTGLGYRIRPLIPCFDAINT